MYTNKVIKNESILFIIGVGFDAFGGTERVAIQLCKMFRKQNVPARIIVNEVNKNLIRDKVSDDDLILFDFYKNRFGKRTINEFYHLWSKGILSNHQTILVGMWFSTNIFFSFLKLIFKFKLIVCEHCDYFYPSSITRRIRKVCYKFSDRVVLLTEHDSGRYKSFLNNVSVIPNAAPFLERDCSIIKKNQIVFVGHLTKLKRVDVLLKSVSQIQSLFRSHSWAVKIVGEGSEQEYLLELAKVLQIDDLVQFEGATSDISFYYNESKILVLPSDTEALPMVLIESKFFDVIPITTEYSPASHEIIEDGKTGFVFSKGDYIALANILESMLTKRLDDQMLDYITEDKNRFSSKVITAQWTGLLKELGCN